MKKLNLSGKSLGGGLKISKAQQTTLTIVGATSVVLGAGIVLIMDFIKYIDFNGDVIEKQNTAISGYSETIKNSGACPATKNKNGIYDLKELEVCDPNNTKPKDVSQSLRFKIMKDVSSSNALQSIGRKSLDVCWKDEENLFTMDEIDELIQNAKSSSEERHYIQMREVCSALRVIPDALPKYENTEALLSSLNYIYKVSNWDFDYIAPGGKTSSAIDGLSAVTVNFQNNNASIRYINNFLGNLSRSIRYFNIRQFNLNKKYGDNSNLIDFSATAEVYNAHDLEYVEESHTLKMKGAK